MTVPPEWRGPVIGPDIEGWDSITENGDRRIDLTGLPDPFPAELAWMAHWQALDGTRSSVLATNQLANILRRLLRKGDAFVQLREEFEFIDDYLDIEVVRFGRDKLTVVKDL